MVRLLMPFLSMMMFLTSLAIAEPVSNVRGFLSIMENDLKAGVLAPEEALIIKFNHVFDADKVPARYKVEGFAPLKCGTTLVQEYLSLRPRLSSEAVQIIETYLAVNEARSSYLSFGGNFIFTYSIHGSNAVPALDVNPANGVPDYVEKIASYFELSRESEVLTYGFAAPPAGGGVYSVSFADMQSYGYTTVVNSSVGSTRIVMHSTFEGFPPNNDPEGDVWGAARVTAAHEFKHASQYVTSGWSEGGWTEVDATWAEDLVFDFVNDYYNYLPGDSPIRHPETSLDGGPTGTGSYEDCVWQHWMSETWGVDIIVDYWNRRGSNSSESVMDSYEAVLNSYGSTLAQGWAHFTTWNYGTGYRAVPGVGYTEAGSYPYGSLEMETASFPFSYSGSVEHLAANVLKLTNFTQEMSGTLDLQFHGANTLEPMTVGIHIKKTDGTGAIEMMTLNSGNNGNYSCQIPLPYIDSASVVVGNPAKSGSSSAYNIVITKNESGPMPQIELDTTTVELALDANQVSEEFLEIRNNGEIDSVLNYQVLVWGNNPGVAKVTKSIAGSTLVSDAATFLPGTTFNLNLTVYNGSPDEEWLTDVTIDFPSGVRVNSSTDFEGGSYGSLVSDQQSGDGVRVHWHGTTGSQNYGVIKENESAVATLSLTVESSFVGNIDIAGTIEGDSFGANPHVVSQMVSLVQAASELRVTYPNGGEYFQVGQNVSLTWDTLGGISFVDVAYSVDGGDRWQSLASNLMNNGSFETNWTGPGSVQALVRISNTNGLAEDVSDLEFSLIEPVSWLAVNPLSGSLVQGESETITLYFDSQSLTPGVYESWLMITDGAAGTSRVVPINMQVVDTLSPVIPSAIFALNGAYPNPFNPSTRISFSLPRPAQASVQVLDIRGHVVRTLFAGVLPEGRQFLHWDGKSDEGQRVAAGLYLARLRTAGFEATAKMTLAK